MSKNVSSKSAIVVSTPSSEIMSPPQLPIEQKLTRSELIEIMIEDMISDLVAKKEACDNKINCLFAASVDKLELDTSKMTVRFEQLYSIHLKPEGLKFKSTPAAAKLIADVQAIDEERHTYDLALKEISYNRARTKGEILKRFLSGSPEGKLVVENLKKLSNGLVDQLVGAAGKKHKLCLQSRVRWRVGSSLAKERNFNSRNFLMSLSV